MCFIPVSGVYPSRGLILMVNKVCFPIHVFCLFPAGRKGHFSTIMARHCSVDCPSSGSKNTRIYGLTFCPGSNVKYTGCAILHTQFTVHFFLSLITLNLHAPQTYRQRFTRDSCSPIRRER